MPKRDSRTTIDIGQDIALQKRNIVKRSRLSTKKVSKYHWKEDRVDTRDHKYETVPTPVIEQVDLRSFCSPVETQGNLGSCTGQAIAGAIELLYNKNGIFQDISRLYIYYYERCLLNSTDKDSGARIRDGIKATYKWGAALEKFWPYIIHKFRNEPDQIAVQDGIKRRVTSYERIEDLYGCINALANGYPVLIGYLVYSSFESIKVKNTGMMSYPNARHEKLLGGHAVLLVGYDLKAGHFIARNSWGPKWGDQGYFYMPFEVINDRSMSFDFWIIKTIMMP